MSGEPGAQEGHVILLETTRLRLRRFVQADLDRLVALDSDPEVMRYITYGVPTPRERCELEILPRWLAFYDASPLLGYWAAGSRHSGEFIGWFHLRPDRFDAGSPTSATSCTRRTSLPGVPRPSARR